MDVVYHSQRVDNYIYLTKVIRRAKQKTQDLFL